VLGYNLRKITEDERMVNNIPQNFDKTFLCWFQEQTEEAWQRYQTRTFEEFVVSRVGGKDWQQGTRWLGGLREQEIVTIEQHYHVRFPPDYRLFLQVLHSVDRPQVGTRYVDDKTMIPITAPSFYHWQKDAQAIQTAYEWLVEGLFFDVQQNNLWLQSWGTKPGTAEAQAVRVRELVNAAPKLVPLLGHRYLLTEPCEMGNPVLSIHQSDIIIYSVDLRTYFLMEFAQLIGMGKEDLQELQAISHQTMQQRWETYQSNPFWGEFLS
jgi:hypothetical protein